MIGLSDADVIERIEALAAGAADAVGVPELALLQRTEGTPRPRNRRWLAAASVAAVIVSSGAAWALFGPGGSELRTVEEPVTTEPDEVDTPSGPVDLLVPTEWPANLDEGTASDGRPSPGSERMVPYDEWTLLDLDGTATAVVTTANYPLSEDSGFEFELNGRVARWWTTPDGVSWLGVRLDPGRSVYVSSLTAARDQLEQVASELAEADGVPSEAALTAGWTITDDQFGLAELLLTGRPGVGWQRVSRQDTIGEVGRSLTVASRTADIERVREVLADIGGTRARSVDVLSTGDGLSVPALGGTPDRVTQLIVWEPEPGVVGIATGDGLDESEMRAAARSSRRMPPEEWTALFPPRRAFTTREVDGFLISTEATVIASGENFGLKWLATSEGVSPIGGPMPSVSFLDERGQDGGGGGVGGGQPGLAFSRGSTYVTFTTSLPRGATEVSIEGFGRSLEVVRVELPGTDEDFAFTVLPAREVDDHNDVTLRVTMPDGTKYVTPKR